MLQEGVLKFSEENRNIPWRKILEYGFDVFYDTRTPVDLKDKWRTMTAGKLLYVFLLNIFIFTIR